MYWFSLKTPLREGRSATHPWTAPRVAAMVAAPKSARIVLLLSMVVSPCFPLHRLGEEARVEQGHVGNARRTASRSRVDRHEHPVRVGPHVVGVVVVGAHADVDVARRPRRR